jgi:hypothetical protein
MSLPLGMRGGSERGITPGLAAVANAVIHALAEFGVEHIELPATPERVLRAIRAARRNGAEKRSPEPETQQGKLKRAPACGRSSHQRLSRLVNKSLVG